jgi:hypothetical protein
VELDASKTKLLLEVTGQKREIPTLVRPDGSYTKW